MPADIGGSQVTASRLRALATAPPGDVRGRPDAGERQVVQIIGGTASPFSTRRRRHSRVQKGVPTGRGARHMSSLRLLGSVGEPTILRPDLVLQNIGGERCPIVEPVQTETGMIMITRCPVSPAQAGIATRPFPASKPKFALNPASHRRRRRPARADEAMPRCCGDLRRSRKVREPILEQWIARTYFTRDGAKRDDDDTSGSRRVDDVINVAGHRIGRWKWRVRGRSPRVAEAAVVGRAHDLKGQANLRVRHPQRGQRRRAVTDRGV